MNGLDEVIETSRRTIETEESVMEIRWFEVEPTTITVSGESADKERTSEQ
jgi:hypothetical protein